MAEYTTLNVVSELSLDRINAWLLGFQSIDQSMLLFQATRTKKGRYAHIDKHKTVEK